jgi:hypothetical protein
MVFETRKYVIIPTTEVNRVDFTEVLETSAETCRYSVDGSKTFVKYEGNQPSSINSIEQKSVEYSHDEILIILSTEEWTANMIEES